MLGDLRKLWRFKYWWDSKKTPASNLLKTNGMETGSVSFVKPNEVKTVRTSKDTSAGLLKQLLSTKKHLENQDFAQDKIVYERGKLKEKREAEREKRNEEERLNRLYQEQKIKKAYRDVEVTEEEFKSNQIGEEYRDASGRVDVNKFEEDFMWTLQAY